VRARGVARMNVISTRGGVPPTSLSDAILAGLAPDGGLYVPQALPRLDLAAFERATDLPAIAEVLLEPFFAGDRLAASLPALCAHAYAFDAPLVALPDGRSFVLELFHGPTAAFKDFGARFLAAAMGALREPGAPEVTVLVATSGDTGSAVGAAFHRQPGVRVAILYPDGRVSPRQAHQLGWSSRPSATPNCARAGLWPRPTASASAACCRRWATTRPRRCATRVRVVRR